MKKRVGAIEEFMFLPLTEGKQLHITIAITGWLGSGRYREHLGGEGLRWELGCLCWLVPRMNTECILISPRDSTSPKGLEICFLQSNYVSHGLEKHLYGRGGPCGNS